MNIYLRLRHALGIFCHYYVRPNPSRFGLFGKGAALARPADLKDPSGIYLHDGARIGPRSTIMTVGGSRFVMKRGGLCAEGLTVVTSNHKQRIGRFLAGNNDDNLYRDIVVEEDVWMGINVTLLSGAHIGRGCIIGAGAVVRTACPPYSVWAGNPARLVKFKWTIDDILSHERALYPAAERFSREELQHERDTWQAQCERTRTERSKN